jgi:hypothetical protein
MTISLWIGLGASLLLLGFVVFAFRQGMKVKPDKNRKTEDWFKITQGGSN